MQFFLVRQLLYFHFTFFCLLTILCTIPMEKYFFNTTFFNIIYNYNTIEYFNLTFQLRHTREVMYSQCTKTNSTAGTLLPNTWCHSHAVEVFYLLMQEKCLSGYLLMFIVVYYVLGYLDTRCHTRHLVSRCLN